MARPYRTRADELDVFRAVAHPVRRKIVAAAVGDPQSFAGLQKLTRRSNATLAGHLRILREAKLLNVTRAGATMQYTVNPRLLKLGAHWFSRMTESAEDERA